MACVAALRQRAASRTPPLDAELAEPFRETVSCVYYIRAGDKIKIGKAVDPRQRMRELQTGNGETLILLATEPGGLDVERARHRQFRRLRVRGEWFRAEPALLHHIATVHAAKPRSPSTSMYRWAAALALAAMVGGWTGVAAIALLAFYVAVLRSARPLAIGRSEAERALSSARAIFQGRGALRARKGPFQSFW